MSDYIRMGDSRRPTPNHRLNAYCTVIVRVSYGYGYTRGSGRVWVEIFGAGRVRVRVRVASSATGTGRIAKMVDPHTPRTEVVQPVTSMKNNYFSYLSRVGPLQKTSRSSTRAHHGDEISERDVTYHLTRLLIYH